jgi:hypothetical protein
VFGQLKEQKLLSDQMNELLTKNGGLNEGSKLVVKNLNAAIAVSKRPGYFHYYSPPDELKC